MVWGYMTTKGVWYLSRIGGRLDAELYCKILEDELVQTMEYYGMERDAMIFLQDNDPKHTSRKAKECLQDLGMCVYIGVAATVSGPESHRTSMGCTETEACWASESVSRNPRVVGKGGGTMEWYIEGRVFVVD